MLHELDLSEISNYSTINLKLFKSIKYLGLTLTQCEELIPPINDLSHMNELKTIAIDAEEKADANISTFLTSNCINNNITQLYCYRFGNNNLFPTETFMELLTKFPNIKYLKLYDANVHINMNALKRLYPKLKGLAMDGGFMRENRELIQTFGNNFDYLALTDYGDDYNLHNINFSLLEELFLMTPTSKSVNDILKTAKNLKKIAICANVESEENKLITLKEMKDTTSNIIMLCKSLEFIQFRDNGKFFMSILDGIEKGTFKTKNLKRNKIKIHILLNKVIKKFNPANFIFNIGKIIMVLDYSQINDFMFVWELRDLNDEVNKSTLLEQLKTECSSSNIVISLFDHCIVITNNECKINGFNESWKFGVNWF